MLWRLFVAIPRRDPVTKDNKGCSKITIRHKISKIKKTKEGQMLSAFVFLTAAVRRREGIGNGKD